MRRDRGDPETSESDSESESDNPHKKKRSMWTEEEHRLFLKNYKAHPRDWSYLATIVTSKSPTQIRTHAYSVFQRRTRVGAPLPSGFENMVSIKYKKRKESVHREWKHCSFDFFIAPSSFQTCCIVIISFSFDLYCSFFFQTCCIVIVSYLLYI